MARFPLQMQTIQLREREACQVSVRLNYQQLKALRQAHVETTPVSANGTEWMMCPSSFVGVVNCDGLSVVIRPRIPIDRVMFLVGYALSPGDWRSTQNGLGTDGHLLEAIAPAFVLRTQEAIRRGLLQGYRTEEESLNTIRGRIRLNDQINTRFGQTLPVEVAYDDYTEDIEENRLLKAAIQTLWRMPIGNPEVRRELGALRPSFTSVSRGSYHLGAVPKVNYDRLNRRYRPAVELARLIIGGSMLELFQGEANGQSFLVDMNQVFEVFIRSALREALKLSESEWPAESSGGRALRLDEAGQIPMQPGLSWWQGRRCVFVGDAAYMPTEQQRGDIYQMLAYCTAANLPSGMLVYASEEADQTIHRIAHSCVSIEVAAVDITGDPQALLAEIAQIADRVRAHRMAALNADHQPTL